MKKTLALCVALLLLSGCNRDKAESAANADSTPARPAASGAPAGPYSETQAVQIMLDGNWRLDGRRIVLSPASGS